MESTITFFPSGNADTSLIELSNDKVILIDYANKKDHYNENDKRCDLSKELDSRVKKNTYDVVCFTHLDDDHICGSSNYFHLDHTAKYHTGKKIKEMWVPAAAIVENKPDGEASILQKEARHRFRNNYGIKVFSRPKMLKDWCKKNGIDFESRRHLIADAGKNVDTFSLENDGIELFVQSPFVASIDDKTFDRNGAAITLHATFNNLYQSKVIFGSDINWEVWDDIIKVTRNRNNEHKLEWDIFHISHHCSYKSLSSEKGSVKTLPTDNIKWLFEEQGRTNGYIVSPSKEIPSTYDDIQPPHKQAANYYKDKPLTNSDYFKVTMESPSKANPSPMSFKITDSGVNLLKVYATPHIIGNQQPPRAGAKN